MLLKTYKKVAALKNADLRIGFKSRLYKTIDYGGSRCMTIMSVKVIQLYVNIDCQFFKVTKVLM